MVCAAATFSSDRQRHRTASAARGRGHKTVLHPCAEGASPAECRPEFAGAARERAAAVGHWKPALPGGAAEAWPPARCP